MGSESDKPGTSEFALFLIGLLTLFSIPIGLYFVLTKIFNWPFPTKEVGILYVSTIIIIVFIILFFRFRDWLTQITPGGKATLTIVLGIFFTLILVGIVIFLPLHYQIAGIRTIFILAASLFPAAMYYLFIASRKYSLLNEFKENLERLGVNESVSSNITYLQKFQGVYGRFNTQIRESIAMSDDKQMYSEDNLAPEIFSPEAPLPVIYATLFIALGWLIILPPFQFEQVTQQWSVAFIPEQTPVNFAFLGAYFFSIQMLFHRYIRMDLRASAYVSVSLRILLAIIGIWFAEVLFSSEYPYLLVLGFTIGVFPQVAWQLIEINAKKIAGIAVDELKTPLPLRELDGISIWNEARLSEEDIENIPNMATANLVDLMLRTRISPDRIIDWVDQAILYTYLGYEKKEKNKETRREKLRFYGIRTATSLMQYNEDTFSDLNSDEIQHLKRAVNTDPNLEFILKWKKLPKQTIN